MTKPRVRAGLTMRSLTADLEALGWSLDYRQSSRIALTLEALVGELAALYQLADGNRSVPTDRDGRSGVLAHEMPIPSVDSAAASQELERAEKRLWQEYEKLAGVVRRPSRSPRAKCGVCGRRERLVDEFCGPCGAAILREHRGPDPEPKKPSPVINDKTLREHRSGFGGTSTLVVDWPRQDVNGD